MVFTNQIDPFIITPGQAFCKMSTYLDECGGTFNINDGESRIITSPNYPNATGHNLNCSYILHTEIGYSIELSIEVDTEPCCDYVQVT